MLTDNMPQMATALVSYWGEVAETICIDAIDLAEKRDPSLFNPGLRELLRRPGFFDNFQYGLASGVANVLAAGSGNVQAVYINEPFANADSDLVEKPLDATLHLIVLTLVAPSAALDALIVSLDQALTASLKELPFPAFAERASTLDVILVTEEEARLGIADGRLLSSVFAPPLEIWRR